MEDTEVMYVSWGGNGAGVAVRSAFEAALQRDASLLYLAILDEQHFGDLDGPYLDLVVDELQWLLDAQLRLVADQLNAEGHPARILVRVGDVYDELHAVAQSSSIELILIPAEVGETAGAIGERTGCDVELVGAPSPA